MLPLLILGGAALTAFAAPKAAATVALATHSLGGFKAKEEARRVKEAGKTMIDPNIETRLVRVSIPDELPADLQFLAGEYLLTDEERVVLDQIAGSLNGTSPAPALDIKATIAAYKARTVARMTSGLLG